MTQFPPGSTIGIIGGGQLGRMTALAAANLGYKTHIYCTENDCPAGHVSNALTVASYTDYDKLREFASSVDVVTFEFENIPFESVQRLTENSVVRPSWKVLHIAQNRLREKEFVTSLGIGTAPYHPVSSFQELQEATRKLGFPCILKTTEQGYDGKGQWLFRSENEVKAMADHPFATPYVLEGFVHFTKEISVILARGVDGEVRFFAPCENQHHHGILDTTFAPARIPDELARKAQSMTQKIAEHMELIGLIAVEFFVTKDQQLLVNEMAPRPHNSGHWTMDACITSQFEQFVRAVCGLPMGSPAAHSSAIMKNLIGAEVNNWLHYLSEPDTKLHIYGKNTVKEGRKMGHVTQLKLLEG